MGEVVVFFYAVGGVVAFFASLHLLSILIERID